MLKNGSLFATTEQFPLYFYEKKQFGTKYLLLKVVKRCFVCLTTLLQKVRAAFYINSQLAPIWRLKNKHSGLIYLQSSCYNHICTCMLCAGNGTIANNDFRSRNSMVKENNKVSNVTVARPVSSFYSVALNPIVVSVCSYFSHLCRADAAAIPSKFLHKSKFFTLC